MEDDKNKILSQVLELIITGIKHGPQSKSSTGGIVVRPDGGRDTVEIVQYGFSQDPRAVVAVMAIGVFISRPELLLVIPKQVGRAIKNLYRHLYNNGSVTTRGEAIAAPAEAVKKVITMAYLEGGQFQKDLNIVMLFCCLIAATIAVSTVVILQQARKNQQWLHVIEVLGPKSGVAPMTHSELLAMIRSRKF